MPKSRRLLWRLFPSYALVTLLSLFAVAWYTSWLWARFQTNQLWTDLEVLAHGMEDEVAGALSRRDGAEVDRLCKDLGRKTGRRITVILPSGKVVGDSEHDPATMDNHAKRPEIAQALAGQKGHEIRYSPTLERNMIYMAIPLAAPEGTSAKGPAAQGAVSGVAGVLRVSVLESSAKEALSMNRREIFLGAIIVAVAAAIASLAISRRISRPLEELKRGAEQFAAGNLDQRLPVSDSREIGALTEAMNQMATQLADRIAALERQRNEQEAVLSSMIEGVLAIDTAQRVIWMNQAAGRLMAVNPQAATGKTLAEVARNLELRRLVAEAMKSGTPVESDIVLKDEEEVYLQTHGVPLRNAAHQGIGALIVLNDVTRLRRLENVRRDFVANVSHELRTPVTSIKGYVETLLDGAVNNPEEADRFLRIVARQADRLNAIINDLLTLSRIEGGEQRAEIILEPGAVEEPARAAILLCEARAAAKNVAIGLCCEAAAAARINAPLLEEAVANLLDNAIKYSEEGGRIEVVLARTEAEAIIRVRDHGCGIPHEHLPRLFERFYRVDKAHSRGMGGTGLGLAIVKHIVQAHKGRVEVESEVGRGSVFTVVLPAVSPESLTKA